MIIIESKQAVHNVNSFIFLWLFFLLRHWYKKAGIVFTGNFTYDLSRPNCCAQNYGILMSKIACINP